MKHKYRSLYNLKIVLKPSPSINMRLDTLSLTAAFPSFFLSALLSELFEVAILSILLNHTQNLVYCDTI